MSIKDIYKNFSQVVYDKFSKRLPILIFLTPIIGIILTIFIIIAVTYITFQENYKNKKDVITQEFMKNLKKTTKQRVELAYNIIDAIYKSNSGKPNQKELTIKLMQQILDKMRWGKKGYIFVLDFHGNTLYHPDKKLMRINRWNLERNGVKIVQLLTKEALLHPEGTYVKYLAYNPLGKKPINKISYVKVFKPLNIFIGNGVYLDTLDERLIKKQKEHKRLFKELSNKLLDSAFLVMVLMLAVMALIAYLVKKIFEQYEKELKKEKERLYFKATRDSLTDLYNKEAFINGLEYFIDLAKRNNKSVALMFIDLDRFKEINDTLGHDHGDKILKEVANRLKNCVRQSDIVARFGGDEFVIQLNDVKNKNYVITIAQRVLNSIKKPIQIGNHIHHLTTSIGISIAPTDTSNVEELLKNADTAMYRAKQNGKDRFEFFTKEMSEIAEERMYLRNVLHKLIENNEFLVYFQPQIDKNEKLYGSEVLVRGKEPYTGEIILPGKFISIAIETGIIDKIDLQVIEKAIIQYKNWEERGYNPGVISCNVTMFQIEKTDFATHLKRLLEKYNFNPDNLNIEITEESIMKDPEVSINMLKQIRQIGININIDDFGTGYSSLSYLKKLPVSKLKIDRSFIKDIPNNKDDEVITKIIINLAKSLNLKVVAEGVETKIQKDFVFENGCDYIQGYYYSPPLPADEFEKKFLKDKNDS
ncbi:hypothetical protein JCM11957_13610 [Caminibacter profundus]